MVAVTGEGSAGRGASMMDLKSDGRDVNVRLRDDVWAMEEPGTLSLTRTQAHALRLHLNAWAMFTQFEDIEEDG